VLRGLTVLFAVSACNAVLGLDEPERVADITDTDADGIADSQDNCPAVANPAQQDTDRDRRGDACDECPTAKPTRDRDNDGLDDACDSCLLGPQLDDDGDGVMDACDLCPVTATPMQLDDDGDLVGNECDSALGGNDNERLLFDGFTSLDPAWIGLALWALGSDGSSVTPTGIGETTLTRGTGELSGSFSAMFEVTAADAVVGLSGSYPLQRCELRCVQGVCVLHLEDGGLTTESPQPTATRGTLRLDLPRSSVMLQRITCELYSESATITLSLPTLGGRSVSVYATAGSRVFGVDLVL